jgi:triosephosphate isomerase
MKLLIANWKMYPRNMDEVQKYFKVFNRKKRVDTGITTVFCPPFTYFPEVAKQVKKDRKLFLGAQDFFKEDEGSYTGEISLPMLSSFGARFTISGHSERRALGEADRHVAEKVAASLKADFHTILCIGEHERDKSGSYLRFIQKQLHDSLIYTKKSEIKKLVIAYEPIWAIGKGKRPPQVHEILQTILYIKKILVQMYGKKNGGSIPVLYGGSTDAENAHSIVYEGGVDGLLVGRSSLNPQEFSDMITNVAKK